jgi:hypothetical protein
MLATLVVTMIVIVFKLFNNSSLIKFAGQGRLV